MKIVAVFDSQSYNTGQGAVETRMAEILKDSVSRQINTRIKSIYPENLEEYVSQVHHENMIGLAF